MKSWSQASPYGNVTVVVTDDGVHEISLPGDDQLDIPPVTPDRHIARQLDEWFAARRHAFDLALDLHGVDGFRRTVLETLVREVPWGETVSYGELAALADARAPARLAVRCRHLAEEVVALVVDDDERGEVLDLDLPHRFHAELGVLEHLDLGDAVLGQDAAGPPIEPR